MVPFLNVVPDDKIIKELALLLLAAEGPAILGWFVRGAVDVLANGLQDPPVVTKATQDYRLSEDTLASFLQQFCELGPVTEYKCKVPDFNARLRQFCDELDVDHPGSKTVSQRLYTEFGVQPGSNGSARLYKGVSLSTKLSAK